MHAPSCKQALSSPARQHPDHKQNHALQTFFPTLTCNKTPSSLRAQQCDWAILNMQAASSPRRPLKFDWERPGIFKRLIFHPGPFSTALLSILLCVRMQHTTA